MNNYNANIEYIKIDFCFGESEKNDCFLTFSCENYLRLSDIVPVSRRTHLYREE